MRISRKWIAVTTMALLVLGCARPAAQPASPAQARTFASPGQAAQALYEAERSNDDTATRAILGTGPALTSAVSDIDDNVGREQFVNKYREMHRLVREPDGTMILHIGAENWPYPVPLVAKQGRWYFDSDAGSQEVLAREIGRNETSAVEVCQAFVGGAAPGTGSDPSGDRIQPFASALRSAGGSNATDRRLFEGYYFRVVQAEPGAAAVALVAYPAAYRASGVMTFVLTKDGAVYERDLGPQTVTLAQQLRGEPSKEWVLVE